jgi:serine/threonine protein kinase/Tol biopolymer transport system component
MTPEHWRDIERLYHSAREGGLAVLSGTDPELRREVEKLLAQDASGRILDRSASDLLYEMALPEQPDNVVSNLAGRTISHYSVLERLGAGGMGVVYKAFDTKLNRPVALKFLPQQLRHDPELKDRLTQEARAASALDHPNIVVIHEISEAGDDLFIAMAFHEGATLRARITSPMSIEDALQIARQVASGLAKAHENGILHRDIKPSNVVVAKDGIVRIIDFGLAKSIDGPVTFEAEARGTPLYMSPEQASAKPVDARTDIWSLGVVLYEMLAGAPPFRGESTLELMRAIVHDEPPPLRVARPGLPAEVAAIVSRALQKEPAKRYQSAAEMRDALAAALTNGADARQSSLRRRWLWPLAGFCAALSVAVAVWPLLTKRDDGRQVLLHPVPLTSYAGQELQPSFSPDGGELAFMWDGEKRDNFDIYIKRIGTDMPLRLTTDPARDFSPAWSPDGRSIAFARLLSPVTCGIYVLPALGGPERKIGETRAPTVFWPHPLIAWLPDGKSLVVTDVDDPSEPFAKSGYTPARLFLLSIQSGERRRLTSHPADSYVDGGPAIAPSGALAFVRVAAGALTSDVYFVRLSSDSMPRGEPQRLTSLNQYVSSLAWTPDETELILASGQWNNSRLSRLRITGMERPRGLEFAPTGANHPAISRQGHLAYSEASSDLNIWRAELSSPGHITGPPAPAIVSTWKDVNPQFSPDGKRVVFCSDRSGSLEIWVSNTDGSNAMQLTSMHASVAGSPRWSPDGTRIVFDSTKEGQSELYVINATGGEPRRLTNDPAADGVGSWSRDGRWIYFMSNRGGTRHVWKMPAEGGTAVQVTRHNGHVAFESPDGSFVYFSERAGEGERNGMGGLWRIPVDGGEETQVLPSVTFLNFAIAKEGIYFIPRADGARRYSIHFFSFSALKSWPVLRLTGEVSNGLSVSPDGRMLLYAQREEPTSDLMLVQSFR